MVADSNGAAAAPDSPVESQTTNRHGYDFVQDSQSRTADVSGELQSGTASRSRQAQASAGGADRLPTDDGGHYIGARFNGPRDAFNHFAQDSNFNRGAYRAMEDEWARLIARGSKVRVRITPRYSGNSLRPSSLTVWWTVDGNLFTLDFSNSAGGQ